MSGVNIDGVVAVNLKGFVDLVENLPGGGVWLDIPAPLSDDAYYNSQQQLYPVNFQKGCQFLDPEDTLAYARSRHQDSDYQRERRQQFVLTSIRKQLDPLALLPHVPGLLNAAQANLFMTFSSDDFPYLAQVASRVDADRLYQYDFAPAHLVPLGSMAGMQAKVQNIFSEPEPDPAPQQPGDACPPN
jgi:anionic cell wall polymer biosynthesis LytR-Cps2A-Psr (LCP) family protein